MAKFFHTVIDKSFNSDYQIRCGLEKSQRVGAIFKGSAQTNGSHYNNVLPSANLNILFRVRIVRISRLIAIRIPENSNKIRIRNPQDLEFGRVTMTIYFIK